MRIFLRILHQFFLRKFIFQAFFYTATVTAGASMFAGLFYKVYPNSGLLALPYAVWMLYWSGVYLYVRDRDGLRREMKRLKKQEKIVRRRRSESVYRMALLNNWKNWRMQEAKSVHLFRIFLLLSWCCQIFELTKVMIDPFFLHFVHLKNF